MKGVLNSLKSSTTYAVCSSDFGALYSLMFGVRDECNMFTTSLNQTSNMPHPIS